MLAVIKTGGKQYLVKKGSKIRVEKLAEKEGAKIAFKQVLFLGDEKRVQIGNPFIKSASIEAKVLKQGKSKKVWGMKYKAKKRYKIKFGHRQPFTEVEITKIG